ncbi:hypothetical protein C8F04DRAFT_1270639 [Mycena alexandri]|uniref:Uncharacterized protein n=1 Tax=Mycena alexandri TaxID=1745969 RepID=A0AAD6SDE3_9AGAR|nr:hypothetical protein C8F04DRAFT_1270639 [Mycena alexandri]
MAGRSPVTKTGDEPAQRVDIDSPFRGGNMDAYRMGLNLRQAAYAVREYSSHRRIPVNAMTNVNIIARGDVGKA